MECVFFYDGDDAGFDLPEGVRRSAEAALRHIPLVTVPVSHSNARYFKSEGNAQFVSRNLDNFMLTDEGYAVMNGR